MEFHLSRELLDQIIFGMENQDTDFYVDTETEDLVTEDQIDPEDEDRYVSIPEWHSVDGYNLMEKFVATLHNPIYRESLRRILASGKGVFRQFKDALKERREIERLWYNFKERAMRDVVVDWYNDLRESWGLERVGLEIEEDTEQLVLTDFIIAPPDPAELSSLEELDRGAFRDMLEGGSDAVASHLYHVERAADPPLSDPRSVVLTAATPSGDIAGFLWSVHDAIAEGHAIARVRQLYVSPEYRGLGLAKTMVTEYLKLAHQQGITEALWPTVGKGQVLADLFQREGGELLQQTFSIDVRHWYVENVLAS